MKTLPYPSRAAGALLFVSALLLTPVALLAEQSVDRTIPASANVAVSFEVLSGSLRFVGGAGNEVSIRGTMGDDASLEVSGQGSKVDIEIELPDRRRGRVDANVDLEIVLPRGASLDIETLSAVIGITNVEGEIEVESMSADVTVDARARGLDIETVSGRVRVTGVHGEVEIETVSGKVEVSQVKGKIDISAVSGQIEIRDVELSGGDFETVNASIYLEGRLDSGAQLSIESYSGNVELVLPASTSAAFDIETLSGGIDNRLTDKQATRQDRHGPGRRLELVLGSGNAQVTIETLSGNVVLGP